MNDAQRGFQFIFFFLCLTSEQMLNVVEKYSFRRGLGFQDLHPTYDHERCSKFHADFRFEREKCI